MFIGIRYKYTQKLVTKSEGKKQLGRLCPKYEDNIKMGRK
jgi:hypothetical protein